MAILRMDHIGVVVVDLEAAVAFFTDLGMELDGSMPVEGRWVDRVVGLDDVRVDIAMMRTPDGHGKIELTRFRSPEVDVPAPAPANTVGLRRIMFAVDDIDATLDRLRPHGAGLIGHVESYEGILRLCYVRGPEGIIVALSDNLV